MSAVCLTFFLSADAHASNRTAISIARMSGRTTMDVSRSFYHTKIKEDGDTIETFFSAGLGAVWWDCGPSGEGRVHVDVGLSVNSVYFLIGGFFTYGDIPRSSDYCSASDGPALGIRSAMGYKSRHNLFVGGYWEFTAAPGTSRGTRAGLGVQTGIKF